MPKRNLSESNAAPPLSMEDFILQHEYKSSAAEVTIENSLDEYLINVYGRDRYGFTNQEFAGVRRNAEDVILGSGDDGQYYPTDREYLNSLRFTDALRGGEAFYLPTVTENGELDKENPKVVKCMVYGGQEHLLIMSAQDLQQAENNLLRVSRPTFWQRFADGFLKIFGSRYNACLEYENFMKHMTTTFTDMRTCWQRVNTAEIANNAHRAEQAALAAQRLNLPEYTRNAQKLIKRNMTAAEFDALLLLLVGEGAHPLEDIALAYTVRLNHDALVARALGVPAAELLDEAEKAEDREAFLLEHMTPFLLLIKDLEKEARKVDLSAVDALTTMLPHVELESGQEVYKALSELLDPLDSDMLHLCNAYRIEQERQRQLEEEQRQQELKRLEEQRHREENREYYEEQDRKIAEAKRRRDEAKAKNPLSEDNLEFYMNDYKPAEEFVVPNASVFLNSNDAVGDFPEGNIISDGFPKENNFDDGFPKENGFDDGFPKENSFNGRNSNPFKKDTDAENDIFDPSGFSHQTNQLKNPFEDSSGNVPQTITNPFDDAPQTSQQTITNPFDNPFGDVSQMSQQMNANSFDDPFAANPYSDVPKTNQQMNANSFDDPFAANPFGDVPEAKQQKHVNPFDNLPETTLNSNPFGNPFDNIPPTHTNPASLANPFDDAPQQKQEPQIGGMGRR